MAVATEPRRAARAVSPQPRPSSAWIWVAVTGVGAAIAHACGYAFGIGNQVTYFIAPLQRAHPELYRHDWFAAQTAYHSMFSLVATWLFQIEDSGAIGCAIAHAMLMIAIIAGVFAIVRGIAKQHAFAIFAIAAAWLLINGDRSLAGSYLWSGYLQPSLLASVGWVVALAMFVRGKPLATGLALAAGGVFHANFLVLGLGMFTLVELVEHRDVRRLAMLLAPQLLAIVVVAPELMASARSSDPELALWVLVRFHTPGHYYPWTVGHQLPVLVRWVAFAVVVAPVAGQGAAIRRLVRWCWMSGAICALAVPVLLIPALLPLTRLYVWRLAPFAQLAAMLVIAVAAVVTITDLTSWRSVAWWRRIAAVGLAALTVWQAPSDVAAIGGWAPAVVAGGIAIALLAPYLAPRLPVVVALASLVVALDGRRDAILHPKVGVASSGTDVDELYAWARTSTPIDAVFLTPPSLAGFRLLSRRAIVVDLKSPPLIPDELVAWYRRISEVTGVPSPQSIPEALRGWADATKSELIARGRMEGASYLVLDRPHTAADLPGSIFANDRFIIYPL